MAKVFGGDSLIHLFFFAQPIRIAHTHIQSDWFTLGVKCRWIESVSFLVRAFLMCECVLNVHSFISLSSFTSRFWFFISNCLKMREMHHDSVDFCLSLFRVLCEQGAIYLTGRKTNEWRWLTTADILRWLIWRRRNFITLELGLENRGTSSCFG